MVVIMMGRKRWMQPSKIASSADMPSRRAMIAKSTIMMAFFLLNRYFASLDLLDALQSNIRIIYVPRDPETLAETNATAAVNTIRMTDEIKHLLSQLDLREAEVLKLRFGLDRGEPRTLQEVADHFRLKPARIAQIEKRALDRLRSANR